MYSEMMTVIMSPSVTDHAYMLSKAINKVKHVCADCDIIVIMEHNYIRMCEQNLFFIFFF